MSLITPSAYPAEASERCRVAWLPSHPAEGWVSMNRYWVSAMRVAQARRDELEIETLLDNSALVTPRLGFFQRGWNRYVSYPWKVRTRVTANVAHVLDHSYAHLLDALPPGTRKVVTVHDLIPLMDSTGLTSHQIKRFRNVAMKLRDADRLVAISHCTKRAICELLDVNADRVTVSHLGVDEAFFHPSDSASARIQALPQGRYVLSLGTDLPRKNLRVLPEVMHALAKELPDVWLVRAGAKMGDALADECRRALGADRVIELGSVSDAELHALYRHAGALFVPSTLEGWGLPIAEALAAGCPVVCSNVSSLPEAGGGVALMAPPDDTATFAQQLAQLIEDNILRTRLIAEGRKLSTARTWGQHLDELTRIYRRLL